MEPVRSRSRESPIVRDLTCIRVDAEGSVHSQCGQGSCRNQYSRWARDRVAGPQGLEPPTAVWRPCNSKEYPVPGKNLPDRPGKSISKGYLDFKRYQIPPIWESACPPPHRGSPAGALTTLETAILETFSAAAHDEVLQLLVQVSILLCAARLLGAIAQRMGQPSVAGEILAGVLLGPSILSSLVPALGRWIVPSTATQGHLLEVVSLIGVMLLLVVTGLETDLGLIRRRIRVAAGIAIGGLLVSFSSGLLFGFLVPDTLVAVPDQRVVFALFIATAMAITAIPVLAKILIDLNLMKREFGQTALAVGMIDDITGWTLLGVVTALAGTQVLETATVATTIGMVAVFLLLTATAGRFLVDRGLTLVQDRFRGPDFILTLVIVLAFGWGALSQALQLEPVIGAFAIGILFGRLPRLPVDVVQKLEGITYGVFSPIFFAVVGLKVNLGAVLTPDLLVVTFAALGVAICGKMIGVYLGARLLAGQDHWSSLAYGSGLSARGALGIIVATIGLSLGILTPELFSIIVIVAVVTSILAPISLRFCFARVAPAREEEERLAKEAELREGFTGRFRRILIPVRPRIGEVGTQRIQAEIISRLTRGKGISVTLLAVASKEERSLAADYLSILQNTFHTSSSMTRAVSGEDAVETILREAESDYDLLVIGTPTLSDSGESVFGPVIDELIRLSRTPVLVVRGDEVSHGWKPSRLLVPISGSQSSRNAADLALAVAGTDAVVRGVHIVVPTHVSGVRPDLGYDLTAGLEDSAGRLGRRVETEVRYAPDVRSGILDAVRDSESDLLIVGTSVRAGTTRLYLGPRVEHLARNAPCPVLILNS